MIFLYRNVTSDTLQLSVKLECGHANTWATIYVQFCIYLQVFEEQTDRREVGHEVLFSGRVLWALWWTCGYSVCLTTDWAARSGTLCLTGKRDCKRLLTRPRRRWNDYIKMCLYVLFKRLTPYSDTQTPVRHLLCLPLLPFPFVPCSLFFSLYLSSFIRCTWQRQLSCLRS